MNAQTISIVPLNGGGFEVRRDGLTTGELTWDEMLGQVAAMTLPDHKRGGLFRMETDAERAARHERLARIVAARLAEDSTP